MQLPTVEERFSILVARQYLPEAQKNWELVKQELFVIADAVDEWNLGAAAATIKVETASRFIPLKEFGTTEYFRRMYWDKVRVRRALGNFVISDAETFCGRGFIQLTGRSNYTRAGNDLNVPLLQKPELAEEPETAAKIFAWYWKHHSLTQLCHQAEKIAEPYRKSIWIEVRRRINGGLNGWDSFYETLGILGLT